VSVSIQELEVRYTKAREIFHALGPVSLEIHPGEFVSILGPSGCGKSTLAKVLTGMITNFTGQFKISKDVKTISTVFQDYGVFPWKTSLENVAFPLREQGLSSKDARLRATEWLERLRIDNFAHSYPHQLSGGMKQRLSIARALATEPEFLILDEPLAAIDTQLREVLQEEILALHQSGNVTVLQFTHNYDEAILLSDRVLLMSPSPATIVKEIVIPFDRPRNGDLREHSDFSLLRDELRQELRKGYQR
jgi:NitT/TauT family transport system ATP-binding protein